MRIIAGKWRSRQISAPEGKHTRPILDRAKTVLFDILGHRLCEPGRLGPLAVLDLYAGSGALGLEALSRGSRYCLFVEHGHASAAMLRKNLDMLSIVKEAQVIEGNAANCDFPGPPVEFQGALPSYDLVFVDPPYRMLTGPRPHGDIRRLLHRLASEPVISPSAMIVVRQPFQTAEEPDLSPLLEHERRDIGKMTFRFMGRGESGGDLDR
ncbi:MAG: RsmD family RNA methyltransferase [Planctomycetota bacterium]|jgi:16S rRNA (guanine966-N2)-methyltransferase